MIDCGLSQGQHWSDESNWAEFPFDPKTIPFLINTHAHIDHIGRIRLLVKRGFRGRIISTEATRAMAERSSVFGVTAFTFFAGTLGALPFATHLPQALAAAPWSRIGALLWLGFSPTFLGYIAWNIAIHRSSASQVSSFIYFSPPMAVFIGWVWLGERPGVLTLIGGAVTVGGVILANARRRMTRASRQEAACKQA